MMEAAAENTRGGASTPYSRPTTISGGRVSLSNKCDVFAMIRMQLDAGLALSTTLRKLGDHGPGAVAQAAANTMADNLEAGFSFSESAASCPALFTNFEAVAISSAEQSGNFTSLLSMLEHDLRWQLQLRRKLLMMAVVPFVVLNTAFLAFSVPELLNGDYFAVVLSWLSFVLLLCLGGLLLVNAHRSAAVRSVGDGLLMDIPLMRGLLGNALLDWQKARFFTCLGNAAAAGCNRIVALEQSIAQLSSPVVRQDFATLLQGAQEGKSLAESLPNSRLISAQEQGVLAVAESAGELPRACESLAKICRDDLENWLHVFSRIAPLVLFLGCAVWVLSKLLGGL